jgi:hypothetical protein
MALLDFLRINGTVVLDPENTESAQRNRMFDAEMRIAELEESLLEIADAFDNVGWSVGIDEKEINEIPLGTVKKMAKICRAVTSINPFVKRAVNARISYVWGDGVEFKCLDPATEKLLKQNRKRIFSPQAYEELERAAATDGNVFRLISVGNEAIIRVPLDEIVGKVSNPDNKEDIWYYKREWVVSKTNLQTGDENEPEPMVKYYPSISHARELEDAGKALPRNIAGVGVERKFVMQHITVNKQLGWSWGIPDVSAVLYFAQVYKEYLEDNVDLVKAYARIAYQVKANSGATANAAAAALIRQPTRDPLTGKLNDVGGTMLSNSSTELVPQALNASAVNFENGKPLAAAIASGLEVSLDVVLSDSQTNGQSSTLDGPTLKAMASRQKLWEESFLELFEFWDDTDVKITWGQIEVDETHRRVQSVQLAYEGGQLFQEESRAETLKTLKMVPLKDGLPVAPAIVAAEKAAENAQKVADAQPDTVVPAQGQSGAVGSVHSGRGQVKAAVKKAMVNK